MGTPTRSRARIGQKNIYVMISSFSMRVIWCMDLAFEQTPLTILTTTLQGVERSF
jgi:hypothetical protein